MLALLPLSGTEMSFLRVLAHGLRVIRTVNGMLSKVVGDNQKDWDEKLPGVMMAYNSAVHESTGFKPYFLEHGREMRLPVDLVATPIPDSRSNSLVTIELNIVRSELTTREDMTGQDRTGQDTSQLRHSIPPQQTLGTCFSQTCTHGRSIIRPVLPVPCKRNAEL